MVSGGEQRWRVRFEGRVQGVGFRYRTLGLARGFPVTGYVKNLPDGSVELVAEGPEDAVRSFVGAVEQAMRDYIREKTVAQGEPTGEFAVFEVRY